jgi:hypothetical protein
MNVPSNARGPLPWPRWAYVPGEAAGLDADYETAARLFDDALGELRTLNTRKAAAAGDGFVETFPVPALVALLQAKLERPELSKADWIALGAIVRS